MRGIDFIVYHEHSARNVINILERDYGFRLCYPISPQIHSIRADFTNRSIFFNRRFEDHFDNHIVTGKAKGLDKKIVDCAVRGFRVGVGYSHNLRGTSITGVQHLNECPTIEMP